MAVRTWFWLCSFVVWGVLGSAWAAEGLRLYAPFDGSVVAESPAGAIPGEAAVAPRYEPGVRGQALVVGGTPVDPERIEDDLPAHADSAGRNVYFPPEVLDLEQGTVSFWAMPVDWKGSDGGFNVLFRTEAGRNHFMFYKFFHGERMLLLVGKDEKWSTVQQRIGGWQTGEWRHIVFTWTPVELRLFIDGKLINVQKVRFPLEGVEPRSPVSVGPGGTWAKGFNGHTLIDELRIYDRPLSHEAIAQLFLRDAVMPLDGGLLTIGQTTPELDGTIAPWEYSLQTSGFSDLLGMVTMQQSHYALAYDRQHLYVAVESPLGDAHQGEQLELFIKPHPLGPESHHLILTPDGLARGPAALTEPLRLEQTIANGRWTVELAVPFAALGLDGAPDGESWRFNLGRVYGAPGAITSAAPVIGALDDASHFLELRFRPEAPQIRLADLFDMATYSSAIDLEVRPANEDATLEYFAISDNLSEQSYGLRNHQHLLYENGRSLPLKAPRPPANLWQMADFATMAMHVNQVREDGKETLLRQHFVQRDERQPLSVSFFYTLERARLSVTAERRRDGDMQVRFLRPDDSVAWQARQPIPDGASWFQAVFDLDFEALTPGDYLVKIDYLSPAGDATEVYEQAYRVPGEDHPAFVEYTDPEADQVPAPWTPLQRDGSRVNLWNRHHDYAGGFLVSSLFSNGEELLVAPARLRLNGELLTPTDSDLTPVSEAPTRIVQTKRADLGALQVDSRITTHFDGYDEIEMTLRPAGEPVQIQTLSLDFPFRPEMIELIRDGKLSPLVGSKTGGFDDYWFQKLVDAPFLWIGNDQAGFNWLTRSLESWHVKDHNRNVELIREGDTVILRFNLVDTPLTLDGPRTIPFGYVLTPSKPLDPVIQRKRLEKDWQMWSQPWEYFGTQDYETANRAAIERVSRGMDEVFLYLGYGYMSPFHPDWGFFQEEWLNLRPSRTYGEFTGLVRHRAGCFTEGCIGSDTLRNYINNKYAEFFEKAKTPLTPKATSYYFDSGVGINRCFNPHHGCGRWRGLDGNLYSEMHVDEYRELTINVYRMIRRTGPDAKISAHQGWTRLMPLMHFTDILVGGEGVSGDVNQAGGFYYQLLNPELFRATYGSHIWGSRMIFLNMLVRLLHEATPEKVAAFDIEDPAYRRPLLHIYGYTQVHDVEMWDTYKEALPIRQAIWHAQDTLGWDEQVVFHPYWEEGPIRRLSPDNDRVMASAYSKDGKLILVVLNDTDEDREIQLQLDLPALGTPAGLPGFDGFEKGRTYTLADIWSDTVPARASRLILFAPDANPATQPDE